MVYYKGPQDKSIQIRQTDKFLNPNIFKIRNIVMSNLDEAQAFISWMINSDLYKYLGQIAGLFRHLDIPEAFFDDNKGKELSFFAGDCMQVMFSLGKYTPEEIQKFFISEV